MAYYLKFEILVLIAEYGYITVAEATILADGDERKARNHLGILLSQGKVKSFNTDLKPQKAYYLSNIGRKELESDGKANFIISFLPSKFSMITFYHRRQTIAVHLLLRKVLCDRFVKFIPDTILRKQSGEREKVCDGELIATSRKGEKIKIGVEVELSLKSPDKRKSAIEKLAERQKVIDPETGLEISINGLDRFFFFYNRPIVMQKMIETIKKNPLKKPTYFLNINEFFSQGTECQAVTPYGDIKYLFRRLK